jgi:hypothetical protein
MYFFDLDDYYSRFDDQNWNDYGIGGVNVGCGGGLSSTDWEDLLGTGRATSDAFYKAIIDWFRASASSGYTESIDVGCSPSYLDLWVDFIEKKIIWQKTRYELEKTIYLYVANYEYRSQDPTFKNTHPTYEDYFEWAYNNYSHLTGTTVGTMNEPINPFLPVQFSAVSVTYNFGTSFQNSDLIARMTDDENALKELMCSIKNMWSVMDGDTFDELVVDDNGNFLPNSGYTYNMI